ncbi:MAG: acyltransferase family protein [Lachnospiraceae bacterium]|nr:acyltransferase family protein [Lachnospiraceae bacterium]
MKSRILYIDLIRAILCITILLYHMGILKGGYLAVCSFFVLSGYLSAQSLRKVNFSALTYYKSRILRVYVPLIIVVFVSLGICILMLPDLTWISMKQEITSIIFGYNNFWQSWANMDYFARHIDSPYMHLWYIAILLQLELIFPLIYSALEYLKRQLGKNVPMIICLTVAILSVGYFVYAYVTGGVMASYYNTFARCFSWFVGIAVGYWHVINRSILQSKLEDKKSIKYMVAVLVLVQVLFFVMGGAESKLYLVGMIGSTLIMGIMLDFVKATDICADIDKAPKLIRKLVEYISDISYEVFLVQYPVIFLVTNSGLLSWKKYIIILLITFLVAECIRLVLNSFNRKQYIKLSIKLVCGMLFLVLLCGSCYGGYRYVIAPDLQAEQRKIEVEMRRLKAEQIRRQIEFEQEKKHQSEIQDANQFLDSILANHNDIDSQIEAIDNELSKIDQMVYNVRITFVGDSVLLSASDVLYEYFNNCYIDAQVGRTAYSVDPILQRLDRRGILGHVVVINCGANGDCPDYMKDEIMNTLSGKEVFWVTTTNNYSANVSIINYAENYDNLHIIDWANISYGHGEYFDGDGLHLAYEGKIAYSQAVFDAIRSYYIDQLEHEKSELEAQKNNNP